MQPAVKYGLIVVVTAAVAAGITAGIMVATRSSGNYEKDHPNRPDYHYTPMKNWVNDPNGLVYYQGEYHLFYQHDYETNLHGKMSWGHAVSTDLVHWKELPVAISYDDKEEIFSGSAVFDKDCTSGLCNPTGHGVLIAIYTAHLFDKPIQAQHIASSTDLGRTWTKYSGNPVLDRNMAEFRDPKVQRYGDKWLMLVQRSDEHVLEMYKSDDLKNWGEPVSTFGPKGHIGGVWECPDMFELPVDGDPNNVKAIVIVNINPGQRIIGSGAQFFIGKFDGTTFQDDADRESEWLDWGMDNYATITWDSTPDGRRIAIGWMSNWNYTEKTPTYPWRNSFTVPRELKLRTIDEKVRLTQLPVSELASLRRDLMVQGDRKTLDSGSDIKTNGKAVDIEVIFVRKTATEFGVRVFAGDGQETLVGWSESDGVFIDRTKSGTVDFHERFASERHAAPYTLEKGNMLTLRVLVDRGSVEAFAGQGEIALTDVIFPDLAKDGIEFYAKGGSVEMERYSIWSMADINEKK